MDEFTIRRPAGDRGPVEVWSRLRLQFEPKGVQVALRDGIRRAVGGLRARDGEGLVATLTTRDATSFDAENVLFYNVGVGNFAAADAAGVAFRRLKADPPAAPEGTVDGPGYHHEYRIESIDSPAFAFPVEWRPVARWKEQAISPLHEFATPERLWWELRTSGALAGVSDAAVSGDFGIRLQLRLPPGGPGAVRILKPLLDGAVAALHVHDGRDGAELAARLARQLGRPVGEVDATLHDSRGAVLGGRRLLWKRGEGVQWNPGDDSCVAVAVRVSRDAPAGAWGLSGEVLAAPA